MLPALAARIFQLAAPPGPAVIIVTVLAILASALGVMGVAFAHALSLGRIGAGAGNFRLLAYLAFVAPSLMVGFGNVAGLLHAGGAVVLRGRRSGSPGVAA